MSNEPDVQYFIFSKSGDIEIPVGIRPLEEDSANVNYVRIPVELGEVLNQWYSTPARITGGPTHLGAIPLKYTTELEGQVYATTDQAADKEWFLLPANEKDTYAIGINESMESVWTAVDGKVKIEPFKSGKGNQVFRIVLIQN